MFELDKISSDQAVFVVMNKMIDLMISCECDHVESSPNVERNFNIFPCDARASCKCFALTKHRKLPSFPFLACHSGKYINARRNVWDNKNKVISRSKYHAECITIK